MVACNSVIFGCLRISFISRHSKNSPILLPQKLPCTLMCHIKNTWGAKGNMAPFTNVPFESVYIFHCKFGMLMHNRTVPSFSSSQQLIVLFSTNPTCSCACCRIIHSVGILSNGHADGRKHSFSLVMASPSCFPLRILFR